MLTNLLSKKNSIAIKVYLNEGMLIDALILSKLMKLASTPVYEEIEKVYESKNSLISEKAKLARERSEWINNWLNSYSEVNKMQTFINSIHTQNR